MNHTKTLAFLAAFHIARGVGRALFIFSAFCGAAAEKSNGSTVLEREDEFYEGMKKGWN